MAQPIADASVRRQALQPDRSFIVQAPAGSGKTELLIQRFLVLLARVDHPESIVAITFTRKAAGEMRFRLVEALQRAASNEAPAQEHARFTWELARAALARDRERGWQLLENPARLRILTIDALCLNLVRQMPWLSRLGAPPRPEENAEALYREAARATLDLLETGDPRADGLERLLSHLDNNYAFVERLLVGMLGKRDQWLPPLIKVRSEHADEDASLTALRDLMEEQLHAIVQQALDEAQQTLANSGQADAIIDMAAWAGANLRDQGEFDSPLRHCADLSQAPAAHLRDLPVWLGISELLTKSDGERRLAPRADQGFPSGASGKARKDQFKSIELERSSLAVLHNLRLLPPPRFDDRQWQVLAALFEVLPVAAAQLRIVFQRAGAVDFIEVAQAARTALGPSHAPSDLAYALDYRIQHWLVDEFQDTSRSQFDLLRALTAEWQPDDGRTVFLVGDPMQSIYAFRQAEVGLFLQARRRGLGHLPLTPLRLSVNFRSQAGIVAWVNQSFQMAFPAVEDIARGAVPFETSEAFHDGLDGPAVTVHAFPGKNYDQEAWRVLGAIWQSRERDPRGSIAVLVRTRSHLLHIAAQLQQAGIRYRAVDIDPLQMRPVVQDLLALTQALSHTADRPAWLAILRAPWCGLKLADLLALCGGDRVAAVWDLLQRQDLVERLSPGAQERVRRFCSVIERALPLAGRTPMARLVEKTWLELGGPACLAGSGALEDSEAFFDLLEKVTAGADTDLGELQRQVARLYAQPDPESDDSLQLMTIHKSKGLEFDTVILPGLGRTPRNDEASLLLWMDQAVLPGQIAPLLAPIKEAGAEHDALYQWVLKEQNRKRDLEVTRLLYVAATRARKQLHLLAHVGLNAKSGEVRKPDRRTLLDRLWPQVEVEVRAQVAAQLQGQPLVPDHPDPLDAPAVGVPLRRLVAGWQPPDPPPALHWRPESWPTVVQDAELPGDEPDDPTWRRLGTVLHQLLRQAASTPARRWNEASVRALLRAEGVAASRLDEAVEQVMATLRQIASDERGRWLLTPHAGSEWDVSLTGELDDKLVQVSIDRTFFDEHGVRWLVTLRMGHWEGRSLQSEIDLDADRCRDRLETAAQMIHAIDGVHPVRIGVFFPWMCAWREWSAPQAAAAE